jgi:hypothetical protein
MFALALVALFVGDVPRLATTQRLFSLRQVADTSTVFAIALHTRLLYKWGVFAKKDGSRRKTPDPQICASGTRPANLRVWKTLLTDNDRYCRMTNGFTIIRAMTNSEAFWSGFWSVWDFSRPFSVRPEFRSREEMWIEYKKLRDELGLNKSVWESVGEHLYKAMGQDIANYERKQQPQ